MPSPKQIAFADLMEWLVCIARGPQSYSPLRRLFAGRVFKRVYNDLYLIHRIPLSINNPEYTSNDISFINWAVKDYIEQLGENVDGRVAYNFVQICDGVPEELSGAVEYSLPEWTRKKAREYSHNNHL